VHSHPKDPSPRRSQPVVTSCRSCGVRVAAVAFYDSVWPASSWPIPPLVPHILAIYPSSWPGLENGEQKTGALHIKATQAASSELSPGKLKHSKHLINGSRRRRQWLQWSTGRKKITEII